MTPDQINAAVAEACEWKPFEGDPDFGWLDSENQFRPNVHNYHGSLDCMAEAEALLTEPEYEAFSAFLIWHRGPALSPMTFITLSQEEVTIPSINRSHSSSAAIRAEAFLRAKGLWTTPNSEP